MKINIFYISNEEFDYLKKSINSYKYLNELLTNTSYDYIISVFTEFLNTKNDLILFDKFSEKDIDKIAYHFNNILNIYNLYEKWKIIDKEKILSNLKNNVDWAYECYINNNIDSKEQYKYQQYEQLENEYNATKNLLNLIKDE